MRKNHEHQRLPSSISGLPSDLIYEILVNLQVKTLMRFRSVCKTWYSVISDSHFQEEHRRRSSKKDPLLLIAHKDIKEDTCLDLLELSMHDTTEGTLINQFCHKLTVRPKNSLIGIMQTCRGLVCLAYSKDIFIFNPSTREVTTLPPILGYNYFVGFGYVASTDGIKVVTIFRRILRKSACRIHKQMFTLGTREWVQARSPPLDSFRLHTARAPFLYGAIHFLSETRNQNEYDAIHAFDIESEEYRTIRLPEDYYALKAASYIWTRICLNELRGSLCLTFSLADAMELWILTDYSVGKWVKEYIVDLSQSSKFDWGEPLAIMANGTLVLNSFEKGNVSGKLHWYNPRDDILINSSEENCTATTYVESLLPPRSSP